MLKPVVRPRGMLDVIGAKLGFAIAIPPAVGALSPSRREAQALWYAAGGEAFHDRMTVWWKVTGLIGFLAPMIMLLTAVAMIVSGHRDIALTLALASAFSAAAAGMMKQAARGASMSWLQRLVQAAGSLDASAKSLPEEMSRLCRLQDRRGGPHLSAAVFEVLDDGDRLRLLRIVDGMEHAAADPRVEAVRLDGDASELLSRTLEAASRRNVAVVRGDGTIALEAVEQERLPASRAPEALPPPPNVTTFRRGGIHVEI